MKKKIKKRKLITKIKENKVSFFAKQKGISQIALSRLAHCTPQLMSKICKQQRPAVSVVTAIKIARALQISVEELFIIEIDEKKNI